MSSKKLDIYKILIRQMNEIIFVYDNCKGENTSEEFHQLRVEIKKFRAIAGILDNKNLYSYYYKLFLRPIFQLAGSIRSIHIMKVMIQQYTPQYFSVMNECLDAELKSRLLLWDKQKKFFKEQLKYFKKEIELPSLKKLKSSPEGFILRIENKIRFTLQNRSSINSLHDFRKLIKRRIYAGQLLGYTLPDDHPLHQLQGIIGDWHDLVVTLQYLRRKEFSSTLPKDLPVLMKKSSKSILLDVKRKIHIADKLMNKL